MNLLCVVRHSHGSVRRVTEKSGIIAGMPVRLLMPPFVASHVGSEDIDASHWILSSFLDLLRQGL